MSLREWWSRVRGSLRRDDTLEREMDQEMAFHVEMSTRRNLERGMTPRAARRQAKLAFGSNPGIGRRQPLRAPRRPLVDIFSGASYVRRASGVKEIARWRHA